MTPAELFSLPFMQRALLAALFTGLAAPAVGTYLVQRRLALMGDGIGHVAVGVAAFADHLDQHCAEHGDDDGGPRRRRARQQPDRHAGHGDVPDAVAHQREPTLDEVGADGGRGAAARSRPAR